MGTHCFGPERLRIGLYWMKHMSGRGWDTVFMGEPCRYNKSIERINDYMYHYATALYQSKYI